MNFEQVFDKHKEELTQALVLFGEGVRVNKLLADEESKRQEYYKFYEEGFKAGQQSKQQEIDELKDKLQKLLNHFVSQKNLPPLSEWDEGYSVAYANVVEDLEKLIK